MEQWFEYPVQVHPHDTDYAGIVWHGSYIRWLEAARVECLRQIGGVDFADLVAIGCDLPVVDCSIRYHQSVKMGATMIVKARVLPQVGVRLIWDYCIVEAETVCVTAQVTLVPLDRTRGKILRRLPEPLQTATQRLQKFSTAEDLPKA